MSNKRLTYSKAGVSVSRGDRFIEAILPLVKQTTRKEVMAGVGGFAAVTGIPETYRKPKIVVSTDGVGTKVLLAKQLKKYNTLGIDLVAMSVNDILTMGAEPLVFLDYFATSKIDISVGKQIVSGIVEGCKQAGCALVGGETAEMPQVYRKGDFDLAGFCVGMVDEDKIIDGRDVKPGDAVFALPSSGVHSNGFTLVREIIKTKRITSKAQLMKFLTPTRIYVADILRLMKTITPKAMAHITGGGIEGNLIRVLPASVQAELELDSWVIPEMFSFIQSKGRVTTKEMFQTFNMGLGYIVVVDAADALKLPQVLTDALKIGTIAPRQKKSTGLVWKK